MKLYMQDGVWVLPGVQSKNAIRVDLPGTPRDMVKWLNDRNVSYTPQVAVANEPPPAPEPDWPHDDRPNGPYGAGLTSSDVENFILNEASVAEVERIFTTLGTRFKELANARTP